MALRGEWVGNVFYDTPTSLGSYKPLDEMNALAKFGHVLQAIGDPKYLQQYNQDQTALNQQNAGQAKIMELHKLALNMPKSPTESLSRYAEITGDPKPLMEYQIQQNDPIKKIQLAQAQQALTDANKERLQQQNLQNMFSNPTTQVSPEMTPLSGYGPTKPATTRPLSQVEMLQKAAMIAPESFGASYLEAAGKPSVPKDFMLSNGQALIPDSSSPSGFRAVSVPGLETKEQVEREQLKAVAALQERKDIDKATAYLDLMDLTQKNIVKALDVVDTSSRGRNAATGFLGWAGQLLPFTPGGDLDARLSQIKSVLSVQVIEEMKAQSKTGATGFGSLSEKELEVIQAKIGKLNPGMRAETLKENLEDIQGHLFRVSIKMRQSLPGQEKTSSGGIKWWAE